MNRVDFNYIKGIGSALHDVGLSKIANLDDVSLCAGKYLDGWVEKIAANTTAQGAPLGMDPSMAQMSASGQQEEPGAPSMQELQAVASSGISDSDIQAAAKVIKMVAEMKQQSDLVLGNMANQPQGQMAPAPVQQQPQPILQPQMRQVPAPSPFASMM